MGVFRGLITLVLMAAFIGLVFSVYSRRRKAEFDRAAQAPLEEDAKADDKPRE